MNVKQNSSPRCATRTFARVCLRFCSRESSQSCGTKEARMTERPLFLRNDLPHGNLLPPRNGTPARRPIEDGFFGDLNGHSESAKSVEDPAAIWAAPKPIPNGL